MNIEHFVTLYGVENCGLFTVTFAEDISHQEASRRVHNFFRRELSEIFPDFIRVRETTKNGRPHDHFAVRCHGDISTGFNWDHYDNQVAWSKNGRKGPKPRGRLNRTPLLRDLHRKLNAKGKQFGIGRMELVPVRNAQAVGFYLSGYLSKSQGHRPESAKGTRTVSYSQGFARKVKGPFSWTTPGAWLYRAKLRKWALRQGCRTFKAVALSFGPRWAYWHRQAILATRLDFYPTAEHAIADGVDVPPGATNIRIELHRTAPRDSGRAHALQAVPPRGEELRGLPAKPLLVKPPLPDGSKTAETGRSYAIGNRTMRWDPRYQARFDLPPSVLDKPSQKR